MESDWDSIERENPMKIKQRRPSNQLKQPQWKVLHTKRDQYQFIFKTIEILILMQNQIQKMKQIVIITNIMQFSGIQK